MKILHINTVHKSKGGAAQIMLSIHNAAVSYGYQSFIISGEEKSKTINALRARLWGEDGFLNRRFTREMCDQIRALNPNLIHIHNLHGYYCDIRLLAETLYELEIPTVITMHDLWFTTGRCAHPPGGQCEELILNDCRSCPHRNRYPAKWIGGKSMRQIKLNFLHDKTLVVPSQWMQKKVKALSEFDSEVIPNGVDKSVFTVMPRERNIIPDTILAIATHWTEAKGVGDICRLADRLPEGLSLAMIGNDVPKHPRIKDLGYISDPSIVAKYMSQSLAVISASYEESFGLTVAEALSTGIPVIVRKDTAPAEMIEDQRFIVDFANTDEVLDAINMTPLFSGHDMTLSTTEMVDRYYHLYRRLLNL